MIRTAALVLLVSAGPAAAQITTTCSDTYYGMPQLGQTCESSAPAPVVDWRKVKPKRCSTLESIANSTATCQARAIAEERKPVMDALVAGRCSEAVSLAIAMGDLRFALDVRDLCTAPKP